MKRSRINTDATARGLSGFECYQNEIVIEEHVALDMRMTAADKVFPGYMSGTNVVAATRWGRMVHSASGKPDSGTVRMVDLA